MKSLCSSTGEITGNWNEGRKRRTGRRLNPLALYMRLGRLLIRAVEANERLILLHKEGRTIGKAQENV